MRRLSTTLTAKRVDVQVCIIVAVVVLLSFTCVYVFNYQVTYAMMLETLKNRSDSIYGFVDESIAESTFSGIEDRSDMDDAAYAEMKSLLEDVKEATGVRYLYTAKQADDGTFVYVVDGLPSDSADFRYPGDPIEHEIVPELEQALEDRIVYPLDIKDTGWGYVYVSYYPIHGDDGGVVGAVGIEFNAQHQFESFRTVRIGTPLIGIVFCALAVVIAVFVFRRVSNPWYRDLANTDHLTGLKNRNAFEVDTANWERTGQRVAGMLAVDLNGLKAVNDTYGHARGDDCIKEAARVVEQICGKMGTVYRTGGDEFIVCCFELDDASAVSLVKALHAACEGVVIEGEQLSLSAGWALREQGESLDSLTRRADEHMYQEKRQSCHGRS